MEKILLSVKYFYKKYEHAEKIGKKIDMSEFLEDVRTLQEDLKI